MSDWQSEFLDTLKAIAHSSVSAVMLHRVIEEEQSKPTFVRAQVRVSSIGNCPKKVVAQAIGEFDNSFPWVYNEGGHMLQGAAFRRLLKIDPLAQEEVSVPTCVPKTWCHPDFYLPGFNLGVQVKTCSKFKIGKYLKGDRSVLPGAANVAQVLLEWHFWRNAGFCLTESKFRIDEVPERYELLYLAREDFGFTCVAIPVEWDADRGAALEAEFARRHDAIAFGDVPDKCKNSPDFECGWTPRGEDPQICGGYKDCWGREYSAQPWR